LGPPYGAACYHLPVMRGWRAVGVAAAVLVASVAVLGALLAFLAPDVSYQARDRIAEVLSGQRGRKYRIALGASAGSNYRVGQALNKYLSANAGYELELVVTTIPGNVESLLSSSDRIDLATINSADDEAVRADGLYGLAALELLHFFVVVANENPVQDFRDLSGPVNPGVRDAGDPPTLGERVLEYYGMLAAGPGGSAPQVSIVRPQGGNRQDLDSGRNIASTRTQFLRSELIDRMLRPGGYRLLPIRDHQALAALLPGTTAAFIPAGLYGPGRRIPSEPVPTIAVTQLLVARTDVPGRVVRDILDVIYSPGFAREVQYAVTEEAGQHVAGLRLHPAAEIFYHRNDALTSDRLGRLSFVASAIAGLFAGTQFLSRYRRGERVRRRRRLLGEELAKLRVIRSRIDDSPDAAAARALIREADDLLCDAEEDAAVDRLDAEGIQALRSLHQVSTRAVERRLNALGTPTPVSTPLTAPQAPAP
jgi:TRAP-type uncharacterized transport system substrate-binding protein